MKIDKDFIKEVNKKHYDIFFLLRKRKEQELSNNFIKFNFIYSENLNNGKIVKYNEVNFECTYINILKSEYINYVFWTQNQRIMNMKYLYYFGKL